jgi:peroxiredoxin
MLIVSPGKERRMKKLPLVFAGILAVAVVAVVLWYGGWQPGSGTAPGGPATAAVGSGRPAPPFTLPDVSGNSVSSSVYLGKPIVINFFATWCPPCREEIPGFVEVYNKYRANGFELLGIALDTDTKGNLPVFMMQNGIGYRILLGDVATARAYGGVSAIPTTFFVGKDGIIKNVVVGFMERDAFEAEVRKLL